MAWYKRLFLFLFGLSGILSLAALSLVWVGPWTAQARSLILETRWYFITLEVLVCIAGAGLLICLLISLFAPRNPRDTVVAEVSGNKITVTRTAIISQTRHVVEADGTCAVSYVHVRMGRRGNVRVHVKVTPHLPVNVLDRGAILHSELEQGLAQICGECVRSIGITFTEPEQSGSLSTYIDTGEGGHSTSESQSSYPEDGITIAITDTPRSEPEPKLESAPEPEPEPEPKLESAPEPEFDSASDTLELQVVDEQVDASEEV